MKFSSHKKIGKYSIFMVYVLTCDFGVLPSELKKMDTDAVKFTIF